MNFKNFILKYQGKFIDFDGIYSSQCMDLLHQYCVEVLGITDGRVLSAPAAKDIFNNFDTIFGHELFDKITNTPDGIPNEGDIIIWGHGTWGHVAMYYEGNVNTFKSFDQNYPTGTPCHIQGHNYNNVLGWLRYKGSPPQEDIQELLDELRNDRDRNWNLYKEELGKREGLETQVEDLDKRIEIEEKKHEEYINSLANQLGPECPADESAIKGKIEVLLASEDKHNEVVSQLTNELKAAEMTASALSESNEKLDGELFILDQKITDLEQLQPINELTTKELLKALIGKIFK